MYHRLFTDAATLVVWPCCMPQIMQCRSYNIYIIIYHNSYVFNVDNLFRCASKVHIVWQNADQCKSFIMLLEYGIRHYQCMNNTLGQCPIVDPVWKLCTQCYPVYNIAILYTSLCQKLLL